MVACLLGGEVVFVLEGWFVRSRGFFVVWVAENFVFSNLFPNVLGG